MKKKQEFLRPISLLSIPTLKSEDRHLKKENKDQDLS
jgi:hypothetical protein